MSSKIFSTVYVLSNLTSFRLTSRQAHDLCGGDKLIPTLEADITFADKPYDTAKRVIEAFQDAEKKTVISSKSSCLEPREYDRGLYKARHLIEYIFCTVKQLKVIAIRYDKKVRNFLSATYLTSANI